MSHRHSKRRSRNRPRHRTSASLPFVPAEPITNANIFIGSTALSYPYDRSATNGRQHWQQQYEAWQARVRQQEEEAQRKQSHVQQQTQEDALEAHRIRFFGGEAGDEVSLCAPMLQVVLDLFNDIDYQDP